jgi:hypothetical protein
LVEDGGRVQGVELTAPLDGVAARRASRRWSLSTPVVLRWSSVVLVVLLAGLVAIDIQAVRTRTAANRAVTATDVPQLDDAGALYVALAGADATATTAYLRAGQEPVELRARYTEHLRAATGALSAMAGRAGLDDATRARVADLTSAVARYHGLIEASRANNRLENQLGAAYLHQASDLMRDEMLPAATEIYRAAGRRVEKHLAAASSSTAPIATAVAATVVVLLLIAVQGYLAWRTRRIVNIMLLVATVAVALAALHRLDDLRDQASRLDVADRAAAAPMLALSTARILALRARSDSQQSLAVQFTDPALEKDYTTMLASLRGPGGLLARADAAGIDVSAARRELEAFNALHAQISNLDGREHNRAVEIAVGEQVAAADRLDADFGDLSHATAADFARQVGRAQDELRHQAVELVVLLVAAALIVAGLWMREREYR